MHFENASVTIAYSYSEYPILTRKLRKYFEKSILRIMYKTKYRYNKNLGNIQAVIKSF